MLRTILKKFTYDRGCVCIGVFKHGCMYTNANCLRLKAFLNVRMYGMTRVYKNVEDNGTVWMKEYVHV